MERKTRIVATVGPATSADDRLVGLVEAGADVLRVNFSHGEPAQQADLIGRIRSLARRRAQPLGIIADLPGPKLRVGSLPEPLEVGLGQVFSIGEDGRVPVTATGMLPHVKPGQRVLFNDGAVAGVAEDAAGERVTVRALNAGKVRSGKGINLPDTKLPLPALTARDRELLPTALAAGADHVALSFVRSAADVTDLRAALAAQHSGARIVAKIEKKDALAAVEEIIVAADAVMVARGDLGVEIPPAEVPLWQKRIIAAARRAGRPVITATQMLQSMVEHPSPTRAEASDVANAILDSTDAIMLSAETAVGRYPLEAVRTMAEIAVTVEAGDHFVRPGSCGAASGDDALCSPIEGSSSVTDAVSCGAVDVAVRTGAAAIVTATVSGATARAVARHRPLVPIYALSPDAMVLDQLRLCRGVTPLPAEPSSSFEQTAANADRLLRARGICRPGDLVVITAGIQSYVPGTTNLIKVHVIGSG